MIIHLASPIREVRDAVVEQFHQRATACLRGRRSTGLRRTGF